jgi:hypothetical protein
VLLAALTVVGAGWFVPAAADDCADGTTSASCGSTTVHTQNTGYYSIPGTSCGAYVGPGSGVLGGRCAAPGSYRWHGGPPPTWLEIIEKHVDRSEFDPCRVERLAAGFIPPEPPSDPEQRAGGDEWLIRTCMTGYDLGSSDGGDDIEITFDRIWDHYEPEPDWMRLIWGDVASAQSTFPFPLIDYGPSPYPVVGSPTFFWSEFRRLTADATENVGDTLTVPIGTDAVSGMTMQVEARLESFTIYSGEETGQADCWEDFDKRFVIGEDNLAAFAEDSQCRLTYRHSSAAQPDGVYTVRAVARWIVGWKRGNEPRIKNLSTRGPTLVTTEAVYDLPVQEIQVRDCPVADLCEATR